MAKIILYISRLKWMIFILLITLAVFALYSCGGSGVSDSSSAGGGVGGTGRYTGVITGFGSIFVNGLEFQTHSASIRIDDNDASESDLKIGMKVTVQAVDGIASSVMFEPEVKGQVTNKGVNSFQVMGLTVIVNSETKYEGITSLAQLENGNFVEVSGFFNSSDELIAALVEKESSNSGAQIQGIVSNHDPGNKIFKIYSITVDYSFIGNPPAISDGDFVEAEGTFNGSELIASELEVVDFEDNAGKDIEIEGIITQLTSQGDFSINGQRIQTHAQTKFEHGTTGDIAVDVKIKAKGTVNSSGILIADKIEFED
ncbi:MAG: hypothetical protein C4538_02685 [Nitrospiraceae bacterium]|nr:MAG: hypothetical protein C4538_02685 [Nitrospiraceae bacterium]